MFLNLPYQRRIAPLVFRFPVASAKFSPIDYSQSFSIDIRILSALLKAEDVMENCSSCQVWLFKFLPPEEKALLEKSSIQRSFQKGQSVFFEGDPVDELFIVKEGRIKIVKHHSDGRCTTLRVVNSGDVLCEAAVLRLKSYPCSAVADTETTTIRLNKQHFLHLFTKLPPFAQELAKKLAEELCAARWFQAMGQEPVNKRVANVLLSLQKTFGDTLPFTRQDIAFMAGTTVETSIRFLSSLKKRGIIDSTRGKILLKETHKLEEML